MSSKIISQNDAKALLECAGCQLIDIRDQAAFQAGHIAGACHVGDHNIESFIAEADMDRPLVVCCYSGMMSQNAARYFVERGFDEVYSLEGGFNAWQG